MKLAYLICGCGRRFMARDENGKAVNGRRSVTLVLARGVRQFCPECGREWEKEKAITVKRGR